MDLPRQELANVAVTSTLPDRYAEEKPGGPSLGPNMSTLSEPPRRFSPIDHSEKDPSVYHA